MEIHIQQVSLEDFRITENITREAFWNLHKPGCDEHLILNKLRKSQSYIDDLDLIAVCDNEITGHVITTKAKVVDSVGNEHEVLCVGPISVSPEFQNMGIGSMLLKETIKIAKDLGYLGLILYGDPGYYHRFGFVNAEKYRISTRDNKNFEPFMALELQENGLTHVSGKFFEDDAFLNDEAGLIEFEKQFPYKEKLVTDTQFQH